MRRPGSAAAARSSVSRCSDIRPILDASKSSVEYSNDPASPASSSDIDNVRSNCDVPASTSMYRIVRPGISGTSPDGGCRANIT